MITQPPDPEAIREATVDRLSNAVWTERTGLIERFLRWLFGLVDRKPPTASAPSGLAEIIGIIGLVALVLVLIGLIFYGVRHWVAKEHDDDDDTIEVYLTEDESKDSRQWDVLAAEAEANTRWDVALICRYRQFVMRTIELGVLDSSPGRTTGEIRHELGVLHPEAKQALAAATDWVETTFFGGRQLSEAEYRTATEALRAAEHTVLPTKVGVG